MSYKYDYLIVGAGLFGSIVARRLTDANRRVLVVEKRPHIGGLVYTEKWKGINIHKYGAHIFRTDSSTIWNFVNRYGQFDTYVHTIMANYCGEMYNLPFNMNTFSELWGVSTPADAHTIIGSQIVPNNNPRNLEEFALATVGTDIYEKLIKGYTEKQWGVPCTELPPDTMKRIPLRFTYNNNYYEGKQYQGIPRYGYTAMVERLLDGITVLLGVDGNEFIKNNKDIANRIIHTGCIDDFFDYDMGALSYRSLKFEEEVLKTDNFQGTAVVNFTHKDIPFTRIIEHKWFMQNPVLYCTGETFITTETPVMYVPNVTEPYYPSLRQEDIDLYNKYRKRTPGNMMFAGRLGSYIYTDMEETVINALHLADNLLC